MEWMAILSPMIEVWQSDEGGSKTHAFFQKLLTDHNLSLPPLPSQECRFLVHDLLPLGQDNNHFGWGSGVIDLMGLKDTDETAKAGPSKVLQKQKRDADDDNDGDNVEVRSLKAPQKQRMVTRQRGSTKAGPSKVLQNHFLDVSALDDEDEEDKEDCSGDDVAMVGHSQLPPCGQALFASWVDNICCHYESGLTNVGNPFNESPPHPSAFALSISDATVCVYKVDIMLKAVSLKAINTLVPPSHPSIIQEITLVPPEEAALLYSPCEVFASTFWVQVKCRIYKNDVGYVLSWDGDQVNILVAPQDHPSYNDL
ncbi:hypothetical protein SCLCIDRAFT_27917 [Scleroderma citrinum Foug A]|uniref:Uncharacterized protein n=1 Tax=Scleroderma citrinum Foug A TaxID=1036808 RepID=A0A0C3DR28_9AGAM|nr:hypothetical protein SCLCIDRAFT_27917 [Scleroderma citrinum Foug A]